jgi:uncharacterized membrane protein YedE/YeeE
MKPISLLMVLISGAIFGFGLSLSTMISPEVVLSFLRFQDFGLLLVLGGAAFVTLLTYQFAPKLMPKPILEPTFDKHSSVLNQRTLLGAAIFGVGWGISGVCPGPAIAGLGAGNWPLLIVLVGMAAGAYVQGRSSR